MNTEDIDRRIKQHYEQQQARKATARIVGMVIGFWFCGFWFLSADYPKAGWSLLAVACVLTVFVALVLRREPEIQHREPKG